MKILNGIVFKHDTVQKYHSKKQEAHFVSRPLSFEAQSFLPAHAHGMCLRQCCMEQCCVEPVADRPGN